MVRVASLSIAGMTIPVNISLHGSFCQLKDRDPDSPSHAAPERVTDDALLRGVACLRSREHGEAAEQGRRNIGEFVLVFQLHALVLLANLTVR